MVAGLHSGFARRLAEALDDLQGLPKGRGRRVHLAKMGEVSGEAARKWLAGEALPAMKHALLLSSHCGVCVEWLLTGRGPKVVADIMASVREEPKTYDLEDLRVARAIQSLPPKSRVALQTVLDSFVKSTARWDGLERRRGSAGGKTKGG